MEEVASSSSMNFKVKKNVFVETLDSHESKYTFRSSKRQRIDDNANVAKFKGVVPQQNGHWGAQIYANHQRIWLGTFKSENEAAMAYDSAAIKIRSGDSHRNFPWTDYNIQEPNFQNQYTTEAILCMIRDGSYQSKFADFLRTQCKREDIGVSLIQRKVNGDQEFTCIQLFQKELTPSDVGKLNRLVIPKKFAVKYFPDICENAQDDEIGAGTEDIELVFYDRLMKSWKFRYCYWRSSQSFVFTRGWNRFVREKNLKDKDIVTFYTCVCQDRVQKGQHLALIDITYSSGQSCMVNGVDKIVAMQNGLELNLGQSVRSKSLKNEKEFKEEKVLRAVELKDNVNGQGLRLFGVQIK